jgi:hypothetical protein
VACWITSSSPGGGSLTGLCPACGSLMYRRVGRGKVSDVAAGIEVRFADAPPRLCVSSKPFVNSEIGKAELVV